MNQRNNDVGSEWIFCREVDGQCSGLSQTTQVLEKTPKTIVVHGEEVRGWMVKIVQEKSEGHINASLTNLSNE